MMDEAGLEDSSLRTRLKWFLVAAETLNFGSGEDSEEDPLQTR